MNRPQGQRTGQIDRYYAQPGSVDAVGFGFTSLAEFRAKLIAHHNQFNQPFDAYVLHLLDGPHQRLFQALDISTDMLADWFKLTDEIDDDADAYEAACCLADNGFELSELKVTEDDYMFWRDTAEEYARDYVEHEAVEWLDQGAALAEYIDYYMLSRELIRRKILIEISDALYLVRFNTMDEFIPLCSRV